MAAVLQRLQGIPGYEAGTVPAQKTLEVTRVGHGRRYHCNRGAITALASYRYQETVNEPKGGF